MIHFTMDDEFDARLEECAYTLYSFCRYFRREDWERSIVAHGVRQRAIDLLNYIESGFPFVEAEG